MSLAYDFLVIAFNFASTFNGWYSKKLHHSIRIDSAVYLLPNSLRNDLTFAHIVEIPKMCCPNAFVLENSKQTILIGIVIKRLRLGLGIDLLMLLLFHVIPPLVSLRAQSKSAAAIREYLLPQRSIQVRD